MITTTMTPTILSLNIRAGGGKRTSALLNYLNAHDPETVVLTEWRDNPSGREFIAWAEARDMHHACLNDGGTPNGVFVASRSRFVLESATPAGGGTGVLMLTQFEEFKLLACYFPQLNEKARFFTRCAEVAATNTSTPMMIVGDLNTGNQDRDRSEKADRYACAGAFDELSVRHGLHDLWRRTHGPDARKWTWLSHRQNGFRLDHAFANDAFVDWANPACTHDHRPREDGLSDHSAVLILHGAEKM